MDSAGMDSAPMWEVPDRPGEERAAIFGGPAAPAPAAAPGPAPAPVAPVASLAASPVAEFDPEADLEDRFARAPHPNHDAWRGIETPGSVSTLVKPAGSDAAAPHADEPAIIDLGARPGSTAGPRGLRAMLSGLLGRSKTANGPASPRPPKQPRRKGRPAASDNPWEAGTERSWSAPVPQDEPKTAWPAPTAQDDQSAAWPAPDSRDDPKTAWPVPGPQEGLTPGPGDAADAAAVDNPESSGGTRSWGSPASWPSTPTPHAGAPGVPAPAPVSWPDARAPEPVGFFEETPSPFKETPAPASATVAEAPGPAGTVPGATGSAAFAETPLPEASAPATPAWNPAVPADPAAGGSASEWFTHVEPRLTDPSAPTGPAWVATPTTRTEPDTAQNWTELTLTGPTTPLPGQAGPAGTAFDRPSHAETPHAGSPHAEMPHVETPHVETPRIETPGAETPSEETPSTETPRDETLRGKTPSQNGWAERPPVVDLWADADGTSWTTTPQPPAQPAVAQQPTAPRFDTAQPAPAPSATPQPAEPHATTPQPAEPHAIAPHSAEPHATAPQPAEPHAATPQDDPPRSGSAAAPGWDEPAPRDDPYAMYRRPASLTDEGAGTDASWQEIPRPSWGGGRPTDSSWDTTPSWATTPTIAGEEDRGTREQPPLRSPGDPGPTWSGRAERVAEETTGGDDTQTTGRDQVPGHDRSELADQPPPWSAVPAPPPHLATPPSPGPDRPAPPGRRAGDRRPAEGERDRGPARADRRSDKPRHGIESDVRVLSTYPSDGEPATGRPRRRGLLLVAAAVVAVAVAGGGLAAVRGVPGLSLAAAGNGPHTIAAPLDGRERFTFDLVSGVTSVSVTSADLGGDLYRISTPQDSGLRPEAIDQGDRVMLQMAETGDSGPSLVQIRLSSAVTWDLRLTGGATEHVVDFGEGRLAGFDVLGGATRLELTLPAPEGTVRLKVSSGISQLVVRAPEDAPSRLRFEAGADSVTLLGDARGRVAPNSRFTPKAWEGAENRYDIAITGGVGTFTLER
ncbi:hypothetical protein [Catenuloplanes atrovinosus]|uniref:Uncharacterized protein n=1 Tax=Catenuloplanes atrovinosus TaxID=137266 RepID=A0AAE3YRN3_9ACTN|nr:hypothetical protein [Catenuloplanes atrovinosus]MDR7278738.1 hypothetical protein [Catenuloplanes atrovinosus]